MTNSFTRPFKKSRLTNHQVLETFLPSGIVASPSSAFASSLGGFGIGLLRRIAIDLLAQPAILHCGRKHCASQFYTSYAE